MGNRLPDQGEGEQPPALGVPLTCEWRCSGLGGRFPQEPRGSSSYGQSSPLSLLPRLERSSVPHRHPSWRPWFCKRFQAREQGESHKFSPSGPLEKLTVIPIKAASLQGRVEGNLPAQGERKGARTAGQSAFPSWALSTSPPDSCNHLLTAHAALVLTSFQPLLYISTRMLFLKCNSHHVPLLLKILQQVPKIFGIEMLTILHGIQAPSCFGFLTTSHSPSPIPSP